jgi:hypothetical protein
VDDITPSKTTSSFTLWLRWQKGSNGPT